MNYFTKLSNTLSMLKKEAQLAGISFVKMLWQTGYFCLKTGRGPRYFVVAGMARNNFKEADKWLHISKRDYKEALLILNPPLYRKLTQSKLSEKALYQLLHLPTAAMLGYFHPLKGVTAGGASLHTAGQLDALLQQHAGTTIMLKPLEGFGGMGVMAVRVNQLQGQIQLTSLSDQQQYTTEQLIGLYQHGKKRPEFMLEAYIQQSAQFASFNPSSLNTLRLWVLETAPDQATVIGGYLRIGRAGKVIDNASAGGIMCPVNLQSGKLQPGLIKKTAHRDDIMQHPDHGATLGGVTLEHWPEIMQFACAALLKLPHTRFAGLDVSMTACGPVLVEANVAPDGDGAAHANIPSIKLQQAARRHRV